METIQLRLITILLLSFYVTGIKAKDEVSVLLEKQSESKMLTREQNWNVYYCCDDY